MAIESTTGCIRQLFLKTSLISSFLICSAWISAEKHCAGFWDTPPVALFFDLHGLLPGTEQQARGAVLVERGALPRGSSEHLLLGEE